MASRVAAREADLRLYAEVVPDLVDLLSRLAAHRGITKVTTDFMLNLIAYNLIRIPKLLTA